MAGDAAEQGRGIVLGEPPEHELLGERLPSQIRHEIGSFVVLSEIGIAVAHDDEEGGVGCRAHDVPQQQERRSVRPVQVVDHQQGRACGRDPREQGGDRLEQAVPLRLLVADRRQRAFGDPAEQLGEQTREVLLEPVQALVQRGGRVRGHVRLQCLDERLVRDDRVLVAASVEDGAVLLGDDARELAHEAGLADPRLAGDECDAPDPFPRSLPRARETFELARASRELVAAAGKRRAHRREAAGERVDRLQRGELGAQPGDRQLVHALRAGDPAQPVQPEIDQVEVVGQGIAHECCAGAREHDLAPVRRRHQPARAVQRRAEVVAVALVHLAGVDAHADRQRSDRTPRLGRERAHRLHGSGDGIRDGRQRGVRTVAGGLEDAARVLLDGIAEDRVVTRQCLPHGVGMLFPQARRTLDVGAEEDGRPQRLTRRRRRHRSGDGSEIRVLTDDATLEVLQRGRGLETHLVAEEAPIVLERTERLDVATRAIQREHELRTRLLVERMRRDERLELADELRVLAEREAEVVALPDRRETKPLQANGQRSHELVIGELGERRPAPQTQRVRQQRHRVRRIRLGEHARSGDHRLEARGVQLRGADSQHVARRLAQQHRSGGLPRIHDTSQSRHVGLERAQRIRRRAVRPQDVRQAVGRDDLARLHQQCREQLPLPRAAQGELPSAVPDLERAQDAELHATPDVVVHHEDPRSAVILTY